MKNLKHKLVGLVAAVALACGLMPMLAFAVDANVESVLAAIGELSNDPRDYSADDKAGVLAIQDAYDSLSAQDQETVDSTFDHPSGDGQSYGRILEAAAWTVQSFDVDNSTTLANGTYTTTTTPAISSESSKGKSDSSRTRNWWVESVEVTDGKAMANIYVTGGAATASKVTSYPSVWAGGVSYEKDANNNYKIPIDLNGVTYFGGVSSSMPRPIMYSLTATIDEPADPSGLEDGLYRLPELAAGPSAMLNHMIAEESFLRVEGDSAVIIFTQDGSTASVGKYSRLALGKSSELLPEEGNYFPDSVLPEGTIIIEGTNAGQGTEGTKWHFEIPITKTEAEALVGNPEGKFFITGWNNVGSSNEKIPGWYKASDDIYLTLGDLGEKVVEPEPIELTITNNTGMFKAVTASAVENADGSATLTFALSGTGYKELYKGTYEQAVANGDGTADKGNGSWIHGATNADGKLEFQMTVAADELGKDVPVVAVSDSYYQKYVQGQNVLARAFYPRQFNLNLDAKTLVTGDFEATKAIAVTNNVSMFRPAAEATLNTVGGPNSNNYASTLVLPMTTASMSEVFVGTPAEAAEATETIAFDDTAATDAQAGTFSIPVKWVETFGDPTTVVNLANGEPFTISFKSASNGSWYGRTATLNEEAGTLVFDPWVDPAPASTVDELIAKIQVQTFTDTTYADCEAAKAAWDALTPEEKLLVEEYDYFGLDTGDASLDDPLNQDNIGENEILVVSFGTSFNGSRAATIGGVEKAIAQAYPDWSVRRAFTAQIIINHIYARDGVKIDNMQQALDRAVANGVKNLVVQPTHLMHGAEYDELVEALEPYESQFDSVKVAEPLLGEVGADASAINADKKAVAEAVVAEAAVPSDTALVLMGHGTSHTASITYSQMQAQMDQLGYENVFIGTVEGEPEGTDAESVIAKVKAAGYTKVVLRPLMVVAGDHANNDMADPEDEESWYSQFTASGNFSSVDCQIAGLGQIPAVQQIYVAHVADALAEPEVKITKVEALPAADGRSGALITVSVPDSLAGGTLVFEVKGVGSITKTNVAAGEAAYAVPIAPKNLGDDFSVTYAPAGGEAAELWTWGSSLGAEISSSGAYGHAMMNYAAAADNYLRGASHWISDEVKGKVVSGYAMKAKAGSIGGFDDTGYSLVHNSKLYYKQYFTYDGDVSDLSVTVNGRAVSPVKSGSEWYVKVPAVKSSEWDDEVTVVVTKAGEGIGDEPEEYTVTFDAMAYAQSKSTSSKEALADLGKAMALYHEATLADPDETERD